MNSFGDDSNPFAAVNPRPPAISSVSNQSSNDNNPFATNNTSAQPTSPRTQSTTPAAYLPTEQIPSYVTPTPAPVQQPASTRIDLGDVDKRQAELDEREKRLAERERAAAAAGNDTSGDSPNNFPPFPKFCPCKPCFHQDIRTDIPQPFQRWVRMLFYLWLIYVFALLFNGLAGLGFMLLGNTGSVLGFCLAVAYFFVFIPLSYIFWFRTAYRAFKNNSSVFFMVFFLIDFFFIGTNILFALGLVSGQFGFFMIGSAQSGQTGLRTMIAISGGIWSLIAIIAILLTIKIHRLYRESGASIERAQQEIQTTMVNSPTVRNTARDIATAGISSALNSDEKERVIY